MTHDRETHELPAKAFVARAADMKTVALSPTNRFRFPLSGHPGQPELYVEQAGRGDGPPLHRHPWATWELVLEGSVRFRIGDEEFVLGAGDCIYTPPGAAHGYVVESDRAYTIGLNQAPSRLENLQTRAEPLFASGPPDMAAVMKIAAEESVEVLGPPLGAR